MTPVPPPAIAGLRYLRHLGTGGFADVFLYERESPRRPVAVKVRRAPARTAQEARQFTGEADTMAALGTHPHIVQVFSTGQTADRRPYIEMQYCPRGSLEARLKATGPLPVAEVLQIGVHLCSAVETAHRLDPPLLHRDIKPANVLVTDLNQPALTDFGIASRLGVESDDASLSLNWAPPEVVFNYSPADKRSDIYSLGATLWHLLTGHAPFVLAGGDNSSQAIMLRTRDATLARTGRPDVPARLDRLLAQTLSKDPAGRPATARDLAYALNAIETEVLGYGHETPLIVPVDPAALEAAEQAVPPVADDMTRRQGPIQVVDPYASPASGTALPATARRDALPAPASGTAGAQPDAARPGRRGLVAGLVAGLALAGGAAWWLLLGPGASSTAPGGGATASAGASSATRGGPGVGSNLPPGEVALACARAQGTVSCQWSYTNSLDTDSYRVLLPDGTQQAVQTPAFSVAAPDAEPYCLQVKVVRADGRFPSDWSAPGCA